MRKMTPYESKQKEYFEKIYQSKRGKVKVKDVEYKVQSVLSEIEKDVKSLYDSYMANKTCLSNLTNVSFEPEEKLSLLHMYEKSTKALGKLKANIKLIQSFQNRSICPFCGIGDPSTFDHYIPKDSFPQFSVFAPNLIPCCSTCNTLKSEKWLNESSSRRILSMYYDELPSMAIIKAELTIKNNCPKVKFSYGVNNIDQTLSNYDNKETIISHIAELNLFERFTSASNVIISETISIMNECGIEDVEIIKLRINENYLGCRRVYGGNYWKTALYKSMIESDEFLLFCSDQKLVVGLF